MTCDPPHNLRRIAALSNLEHYFLSLQDMSLFSEVVSAVRDVGGHGPCSALHCSSKRAINC